MNRFERIKWNLRIVYNDILREVSWNKTKTFYKRYCNEIDNSHKWCFIVGCNNSGTSLLQKLFEMSGQVATYSTEGQIHTCALKRSIRRGYHYLWSEYINDLLADNKLDPTTLRPRLIHDWMRDFPDPIQEIVVEKTPANVARMSLLSQVFQNSYFIGLIRNGYAVAEGIKRKGGHDVRRGARHWNTVNKILVDNAKIVDRCLFIKYEDLTEHTEETVKKIAKFIGIDSSFMDNAVKSKFKFRTIMGGEKQPIINMNQKSFQMLSSTEAEIINQEASPMLNYFGYTMEK